MWARNVLVTFLLSGLWHGASWNYVLWGLYHGMLLLVTQLPARLMPQRTAGASAVASWLLVPQIAGMFVLTNIGWLLFRETELHAIVRDLTLSPFGVSEIDRNTGAYFFLLAFLYSVPFWVQSVWFESIEVPGRSRPRARSRRGRGWRCRALACGLAFAAILVLRQPHVAGLHLLSVLDSSTANREPRAAATAAQLKLRATGVRPSSPSPSPRTLAVDGLHGDAACRRQRWKEWRPACSRGFAARRASLAGHTRRCSR